MKIAIIVHSKTGNTLGVANKIKEQLLQKNHVVNLEHLEAFDDNVVDPSQIKLKSVPDISGYDLLIFGGPVRGFSMSPVLKAFLQQQPTLSRYKVGVFVTHFFPFKAMGGTQAIKQLKAVCESKQASVLGTGIVNWKSPGRLQQIETVAKSMSALGD